MINSQNQHHVSKYYLKRFRNAGSGRLIVYKRNRYTAEAGVKKVCSEINQYSDELEEEYRDIENRSAPVIKRIVDTGKLNFGDEKRVYLAEYVASLYGRKPDYIDICKQDHRDKDDILLQLSLMDDPVPLLRFCRFYGINKPSPEHGLNTEYEKVSFVRKARLRGRFTEDILSDDAHWMSRRQGIGRKAVDTILDKVHWNIGMPTSPDKYFVTSDCPVVVMNLKWPVGTIPLAYTGPEAGIVCFPLSPKLLLSCHNEPHVKLEYLNNKLVDYLNYLQMFNAHRTVLSHVKNQAIKETFDTTEAGANSRLLTDLLRHDLEAATGMSLSIGPV